MKTLADLKRDLKIGSSLTLTQSEVWTHKFLNISRYVTKTQWNGVYLNTDKNGKGGSFLELPKASLVEYDNDTIKVYYSWYRECTNEENSIRDNAPSRLPENKERAIMEAMTDGSGLYYLDKSYFAKSNAPWMSWHDTIRGQHYDYNRKMVRDDNIKGILSLSYVLNS